MKKRSEDIAISVRNVSKTFRIPHEKVNSLRGAFVGALKGKRTFEEFKALDDVSFEVKKGEFFGIIGRNGSGKSTLLKVLAGIYQADAGTVEINGMISPFLELGIGFNPELSGRDNVYLNATVLGLTKKEIDEKFDAIVAFSELERFIDQKLKNYSSGMQVRLAFSVSIHANRDILLMDEVLAVGDSNFQAKCLEEFVKYKEMGKTVILVTHDIATVQRYCDRAMLLRNGEIKMIGSSEEVGDEYIEENIADEERRMKEEKILKWEKEELKKAEDVDFDGDFRKRAEIINVELLDSEGNIREVFRTGDTLDIRISYRADFDLEYLNLAVGLHAPGIGQIFGYSTESDKQTLHGKYEGHAVLHFDNLDLLKGEYRLNVSCFKDFGGVMYDFKQGVKTIKMQSREGQQNYAGLVDISHQWRIGHK